MTTRFLGQNIMQDDVARIRTLMKGDALNFDDLDGDCDLADLADWARGSIIRGETADWAAYSAKGDGYALVGDGTDIVSTLTPTWKGEHRFNAGIEFGGIVNIIEIPDNTPRALVIEDGGATEYLRIVTSNTQPVFEFNYDRVDMDFRFAGNGESNALFIRGSDNYVGIGVRPDEKFHVEIINVAVDSITPLIKISHLLAGTADVGLGASILYELEDDAGNSDIAGSTAVVWTDATSGSEDADYLWTLKAGGAAVAEKARLTSTGIFYTSLGIRVGYSTNNVGNPPSDTDIDSAFGIPATVGNGFVGVINDNDGDADIWLCVAVGDVWGYEQLTVAV